MKEIMIDVREVSEFNQAHVENSINLPLSLLNLKIQEHDVKELLTDAKVEIMCLSGGRATMAKQELDKLFPSSEFSVIPGGISAWAQAGKPVVS